MYVFTLLLVRKLRMSSVSTEPLKSVSELMEWRPTDIHSQHEALLQCVQNSFIVRSRMENDNLHPRRPMTLICHDMKGGYHIWALGSFDYYISTVYNSMEPEKEKVHQ